MCVKEQKESDIGVVVGVFAAVPFLVTYTPLLPQKTTVSKTGRKQPANMNSHPRMRFAMHQRKDRERSAREGVTEYLIFVFSAYTGKEEEKANSADIYVHALGREWD